MNENLTPKSNRLALAKWLKQHQQQKSLPLINMKSGINFKINDHNDDNRYCHLVENQISKYFEPIISEMKQQQSLYDKQMKQQHEQLLNLIQQIMNESSKTNNKCNYKVNTITNNKNHNNDRTNCRPLFEYDEDDRD